MDKILIRDLKIFAYHGVNEEEKINGQNFVFDIDLFVNMTKVIKTVTKVVTEKKYNLLEKVAQITADAILEEYSDVSKVKITLKKPEAPMKADFSYVGVKIERER